MSEKIDMFPTTDGMVHAAVVGIRGSDTANEAENLDLIQSMANCAVLVEALMRLKEIDDNRAQRLIEKMDNNELLKSRIDKAKFPFDIRVLIGELQQAVKHEEKASIDRVLPNKELRYELQSATCSTILHEIESRLPQLSSCEVYNIIHEQAGSDEILGDVPKDVI